MHTVHPGTLRWTKGGFQDARASPNGAEWYVDNVFECIARMVLASAHSEHHEWSPTAPCKTAQIVPGKTAESGTCRPDLP